MSSLRTALMNSHLEVEHEIITLKRAMEAANAPGTYDRVRSAVDRVEVALVSHFTVQHRLLGLADRTFGGELDESRELAEVRTELLLALQAIRESSSLQNKTATMGAFRVLRETFDQCTDLEWGFITRYGTIIFPALCGGS